MAIYRACALHVRYQRLQTHRICNTYCFSTAKMVTRTLSSVTFIRILPVLLLTEGASERKILTLISPRSPVVSLGIFFRGIRQFHVPRFDPASKINKYQDTPGDKDGRCVWLTTYHLQVPMSRNLGALTSKNPLGPIGL
jgi:hypothetical protein